MIIKEKIINVAMAIDLVDDVLIQYTKIINDLENDLNINFIKKSQQKPHCTLCIGEVNIYDLDDFIREVKIFCSNYKVFEIESNGYGIFLNTDLNLFLRWTLSDEFIKFKTELEAHLKLAWKPNIRYNHFSYWIPKTSLAYKDLTYSNLKKVNFEKYSFNNMRMLTKQISIIKFEDGKNEEVINSFNLKESVY